MKSLYYGLAYGKRDKLVRVPIESTNRLDARIEAEEYCKQNGFRFDGVHRVQGTGKEGATLTKFAAYRKQHPNRHHPHYSKTL
jgi:hypothetical protein